MGDKLRAKEAARQAGVPVVPSYTEAEARAGDAPYPLIVKAAAGGGGRGMRVIASAVDLDAALESARREAKAGFADERVFIERFLPRARHIEVQVLADTHGTVVHLGERECSLQRRHQKVVEECPSPVVSVDFREQMGTAAVALARVRRIGNRRVRDARGRERVFLSRDERPACRWSIRSPSWCTDSTWSRCNCGWLPESHLSSLKSTITPRGHAIEARLYAEDPSRGFLPSVGTVRRYRPPANARVDSALREGLEIGTSFDPMLGKVIAHGVDRRPCIDRLDRALAELEFLESAPTLRSRGNSCIAPTCALEHRTPGCWSGFWPTATR